MAGQVCHKLGVATTEQNRVADHRSLEESDDIEDGLTPALLAATFEAHETNIILIGETFFVRQVGEFERDDGAVEDERRAQPRAGAEEGQPPPLVAAGPWHG